MTAIIIPCQPLENQYTSIMIEQHDQSMTYPYVIIFMLTEMKQITAMTTSINYAGLLSARDLS